MDANAFLYLNPTGIVGSYTVTTASEVNDLWNSSQDLFDNLPINLDYVSDTFNSKLFAIDNRFNINFSQINKEIYEGAITYTTNTIPYYFPYITKEISCIEITSNGCVFSYIPETYPLLPDDNIHISFNSLEIYGNVKSVTDTSFETDIREFNIGENVILRGTQIYDIERLAKIAYYNIRKESNQEYTQRPFNYNLYTTLYGGNFDSFEEAYIHSVLNSDGDTIYTADDIVNINSDSNNVTVNQTVINKYEPSNVFEDITITNNINFKNYNISYITTDYNRSLDTIASTDIGLISEYAIKKYIHEMLYPIADFNNITAESLTISTLNVSEFGNDIKFQNNIAVESNIETDSIDSRISHSTKYAISSRNTESINAVINQNTTDISITNLNATNDLYVGNICQIDGDLLNSRNIKTKNGVYGSKLGIGNINFETSNTTGDINTIYSNYFTETIKSFQFINTLYSHKYLSIYDNDIIEDLEAISAVTNKMYNIDGIVLHEENKIVKYNRNQIVTNNNVIVFEDNIMSDLHILDIGDVIVTDVNRRYNIIDITNNNIIVEPNIEAGDIHIKEFILKNKQYIDVENLLKELTGQIKELANLYKISILH